MSQRAKNLVFGGLMLAAAFYLYTGGTWSFSLLPGGAPFPAERLSVVVVRESQSRLPDGQVAVLSELQKLPAGSWRVYDPNQDAAKDDPWVASAVKAIQESGIKPPVIAVSNGRSGTVAPLPADEPALAELLKRYGG